MVALALSLYTLGLSTTQVSHLLKQLGVEVSNVSVWNWVHKYSQRVDPQELPPRDSPQVWIVDDTALQLGRDQIWLFLATEPGCKAIVYAEPYVERTQGNAECFFLRIRNLYGRWPHLLVRDLGPWYRAILVVLARLRHLKMARGIRNYVGSLFTQLKGG